MRRHFHETGFGTDRLKIAPLLFLGVGFGIGDLDADRPKNADVARLAADRGQLGVKRFAVLLHGRNRAARAELHVGVGGSEVQAGARETGLDDDWPMLRRRQRWKRATHVEIPAAVIDPLHLGQVSKDAFLPIRDQRILLDAVPQLAGHSEKLLRSLVALVVLHHGVEAVIRGFVLVGRRHGVPCDPTARYMVERIEEARDVERMVIGRRHGDGEAHAGRGLGHQRNHRRHVMAGPFGAIAHARLVVAAVVLGRAASVAEEQHVHHAALGDTGDVLVEIRRAVVVVSDPRAGQSPHIVRVQERQVCRKVDGCWIRTWERMLMEHPKLRQRCDPALLHANIALVRRGNSH